MKLGDFETTAEGGVWCVYGQDRDVHVEFIAALHAAHAHGEVILRSEMLAETERKFGKLLDETYGWPHKEPEESKPPSADAIGEAVAQGMWSRAGALCERIGEQVAKALEPQLSAQRRAIEACRVVGKVVANYTVDDMKPFADSCPVNFGGQPDREPPKAATADATIEHIIPGVGTVSVNNGGAGDFIVTVRFFHAFLEDSGWPRPGIAIRSIVYADSAQRALKLYLTGVFVRSEPVTGVEIELREGGAIGGGTEEVEHVTIAELRALRAFAEQVRASTGKSVYVADACHALDRATRKPT